MPHSRRTTAEAKARRMQAAEVTLMNYYENLLSKEHAMEALASMGYLPLIGSPYASWVARLEGGTGWLTTRFHPKHGRVSRARVRPSERSPKPIAQRPA